MSTPLLFRPLPMRHWFRWRRRLRAGRFKPKRIKAVQFLRDVVGDDDKADEFDDMDVEAYAERKHIQIINPRRNTGMPNGDPRTKSELLGEIDQLQQENQDLQDQLDAISDIISPPEEEDDDDADDDSD
jgi:hypothetical protein